MLQIVRTNAWAYLEGHLSPVLRAALHWHLSVKLPPDRIAKLGARFSQIWTYGRDTYGSMFHEGLGRGQHDRVPQGLCAHAAVVAQRMGIAVTIQDQRDAPMSGYPLHMLRVPWRPYQDEIHERIVRQGAGVVVAPPRSGKTAMAARAIDVHGLPAVYIAPSVPIVRQTYEVFRKMFGDELVGRIDGEATDAQKADRMIMICTATSAARLPVEWWAKREMLIIDEAHHAAAETWHEISAKAAHIFYRLCFTGTHFRSSGDDLAMHAITGQLIAEISVDSLVRDGFLAYPKIFFLSYNATGVSGASGFTELYNRGIVGSAMRNQAVVNLALQLMAHGDRVIVLTRRRSHADKLGEQIPDSVVVKGSEGALTSRSVADFLAGRYQALVGTAVIGEGVDVPAATSLIYASGGSGTVQQVQSYYRPLTAAPGKQFGRIYDFVDRSHATLLRHSQERIAAAVQYVGAHYVHVV